MGEETAQQQRKTCTWKVSDKEIEALRLKVCVGVWHQGLGTLKSNMALQSLVHFFYLSIVGEKSEA